MIRLGFKPCLTNKEELVLKIVAILNFQVVCLAGHQTDLTDDVIIVGEVSCRTEGAKLSSRRNEAIAVRSF